MTVAKKVHMDGISISSAPPAITPLLIDVIYANIKDIAIHPSKHVGTQRVYLFMNIQSIRAILEWLIAANDRWRMHSWMEMIGRDAYSTFVNSRDVIGKDDIIAAMYHGAGDAERTAISDMFAKKYTDVEKYVTSGSGGIDDLLAAAYEYGHVNVIGLCRYNYAAAKFMVGKMADVISARYRKMAVAPPTPAMIHASMTPEMIHVNSDTSNDDFNIVKTFIRYVITLYGTAMIDHYLPISAVMDATEKDVPTGVHAITTAATDVTWSSYTNLDHAAMFILSRGFPIHRSMMKQLHERGWSDSFLIHRGTGLTAGVIKKRQVNARNGSYLSMALAMTPIACGDDDVCVYDVHKMYRRVRMPVPRGNYSILHDVLVITVP